MTRPVQKTVFLSHKHHHKMLAIGANTSARIDMKGATHAHKSRTTALYLHGDGERRTLNTTTVVTARPGGRGGAHVRKPHADS